jgi:hypothetical protein
VLALALWTMPLSKLTGLTGRLHAAYLAYDGSDLPTLLALEDVDHFAYWVLRTREDQIEDGKLTGACGLCGKEFVFEYPPEEYSTIADSGLPVCDACEDDMVAA